jgi:hypothetical protein
MVNWGDVPTWATAGVALLALIAATRAYRTQSVQLEIQEKQLEDQTRIQEREQANLVDVSARNIGGAEVQMLPPGNVELVHMIVVANGSKRPVRYVSAQIDAIQAATNSHHEKLADAWGALQPFALGMAAQGEAFVFVERTGKAQVLRAGEKIGFVWAFPSREYPRITFKVRFTDDAGLEWEIDNILHLVRVISRDW